MSENTHRWGLGVTEFPWLRDHTVHRAVELHATYPVGEAKVDNEKKFILWDPRDEDPPGRGPRRDEEGNIDSDGLIGRVGPSNVYIKAYANYEKEKRDINNELNLEVGEYVWATFNLSGTKGRYQVWRVQ